MKWSDVVACISLAAPTLGSLFGPAGTAVGTIVGSGIKLVASALGVAPTQDAITAAVIADPEAALKLKQFEMNHRIEIEKLAIQEYQMELLDIQSARGMRIEHEKVTDKSDVNLYMLAWTIVTGFFVLMGILIFIPLPTDAAGVLFMLFGALSAGFGSVLSFFFGSNKSSENKTNMIYKSTPNSPKAAV